MGCCLMEKIKQFILVSLKSISQVIFVENSVSGLIMLMAVAILDYKLGIITFLSGLIGSLVASFGGADKDDVEQGLYGFNSVLIGMALFIFIQGPIRWIIALIGAGFGALYYGAIKHILRKTELPVLTFPYITSTWIILLASYSLGTFQLAADLIPNNLADWTFEIGGSINYVEGLINGIGQVYFQTNIWAGILILIAVFWDSKKLGVYTILGTIVGTLTAYIVRPEINSINLGLYGYNAVLAIITIYTYGDETNKFRPITGIIAAMATIPIIAGINTLFIPYGIPTLTMPFVLVSWIFIGTKKILPKI